MSGMRTWDASALPPEQALRRLLDGNARFVAGKGSAFTGFRADFVSGQSPSAVVVGCSDSRVPAEIVFDVGLGDLFVVRVAGNIVAASQVGSVEFAVSQFGTRLVVVMGHTRCGAIDATLRAIDGAEREPGQIAWITERILPAIREVAAAEADPLRRSLAAMAANVRASATQLSHGSKVIEDLVQEGRVQIVAAVYAVESGAVTILDGAVGHDHP